MSQQPLSDRAVGKWLNRRFGDAGAFAAAALAAPLGAGALLAVQAWLIAHALHGAIVEHTGLSALAPTLGAILGLVTLRAGLGTAGEMAAVAGAERIKSRLRMALFDRMLERGPVWTSGESSGALSAIVIEDVDAIDGFLVRYLPAMVQAAILPISFAALILPIDWIVGLIFLVIAPLIPVFMMLVGWGAEAASRAQTEAMARLTGRFADRLRGLLTLKLFGRAAAETEAMHEAGEELRQRTMRVMRIAFLSSAVLEFFAALGVAGVALYVGLSYLGLVHLRAVPMTLEAGLFCLVMAPEVYNPLRQLAANYHDRAAAKAAARQIEATLGILPDPSVAQQPAALGTGEDAPRSPAGIWIERLSVDTPDGRPVLRDVSLSLAAGTATALLGPSGSGKSTLLEAIAGLRPYYGVIRIGEVEAAGARQAGGPRVALLSQRPHVFAGTIADNIRLPRPQACGTAVRLAAERAFVTDFADRLPHGLDTPIGENGLGLSGGEIQRIALARVYLTDPDLILLDEPTAHLDPESEQEVLARLMTFAASRTLLVATHSAAVAACMGRAVRIADGRLFAAIPPAMPAPKLKGAA